MSQSDLFKWVYEVLSAHSVCEIYTVLKKRHAHQIPVLKPFLSQLFNYLVIISYCKIDAIIMIIHQ